MEQLYILCERLVTSPAPARVRYEIGCELRRMTTDTVQEYDFFNIFRLLNFYLPQTKYGFNLQIVLNFTEIVHPDTIILFQAVQKPFFHIIVAHTLVQNLDKYLERWQPDPSLIDQYKRTALHVATWNVSVNCEKQLLNIRTLLNYGFDPKLKWHRVSILEKLEFFLQTLMNRKYTQEKKNQELQQNQSCFDHPNIEIQSTNPLSGNITTIIDVDDHISDTSDTINNETNTIDNDQSIIEIPSPLVEQDTVIMLNNNNRLEDAVYDHIRVASTKLLEEKIILLNTTIAFAKLVIKTHEAIKRGIRKRIKRGTLHQDTAIIIYELLGWRWAECQSRRRLPNRRRNRFSRIQSCGF